MKIKNFKSFVNENTEGEIVHISKSPDIKPEKSKPIEHKKGIFSSAEIYSAIASGGSDRIKSFLNEGMDPNFNMGSPLRLAAECGNLEATKLLIEHGADPTMRRCMPIKWAINSGHFDVLYYLCEQVKDKIKGGIDQSYSSGSGLLQYTKETLLNDIQLWVESNQETVTSKTQEIINKVKEILE